MTTPSLLYKLKVEVITDGCSKILKITDAGDDQEEEEASTEQHQILPEAQPEIKIKILEMNVNSITLSFVHKACELMTIFMNRLHAHITESE